MRWDKAAEKLMTMDDAVWQRHANPWSVWTRVAITPFLFLAVWSYVWIGWWALVPCAAVALFTWLNPRIFPVPKSTNNWASKGVMGERVFINRKTVPIPRHHAVAAQVLTALSAIFLIAAIYGFVVGNFWAAFLGFHAAIVCKIWFVDRMAWLFEDMKDHDAYEGWLR